MYNFKYVNNWLADRAAFLRLTLVYYKAAIYCYTVNISRPTLPHKGRFPKRIIITEFKHSYSSLATENITTPPKLESNKFNFFARPFLAL